MDSHGKGSKLTKIVCWNGVLFLGLCSLRYNLLLLKGFLPDWLSMYFSHDRALTSKVLIAQTQKIVDNKCCK